MVIFVSMPTANTGNTLAVNYCFGPHLTHMADDLANRIGSDAIPRMAGTLHRKAIHATIL